MTLSADLKAHLEQHIADCEKELDDDAESIITNQRYSYAVLDQPVEPAALGHAQSAQNGVKQAGDHLAEEVVVGPVGAPGADANTPFLALKQGPH